MAVVEPVSVRLPCGTACVLRSAAPDDADALVAFEVRSNASNPFNVRDTDEVGRDVNETREWLTKYRDSAGRLMLLAIGPVGGPEGGPKGGPAGEPGGGILGELSFRTGERRKLAHHGSFGVSVDADWRGRGVGTALIVKLLDWAAAHPVIEKVCLGCFETNVRARALYRRLGFVEEGRQRQFFKLGPGSYVDDIQMCIYVKPGVAPEGFGVWKGVGAARGDEVKG